LTSECDNPPVKHPEDSIDGSGAVALDVFRDFSGVRGFPSRGGPAGKRTLILGSKGRVACG
jgi:hypothetical protein